VAARETTRRRVSGLLIAWLAIAAAIILAVAWLNLTDAPAETTPLARIEVALPPPATAEAAPSEPASTIPSASAEAPAAPAAPAAPPPAPSISVPAVSAPSVKPEPPKAAASPPPATANSPPVQQAAATPGPRSGPDPALLEPGPDGSIPRLGPDGRASWQVYARPFDRADKRPRIAVVIANLGLGEAQTEAAIQRLPGGVTLAFSPYAGPRLPQWMDLARIAGHEVLMGVPMEPANYPESDPGPHTLLTSLPAPQNIERLHWVLGRATGYVGIMNQMGQRFTANVDSLRPVMVEIKGRGLLVLDTRAAAKSAVAPLAGELDVPRATNDRTIDAQQSRDAIAQRLAEIEAIAKKRGSAVAIGSPFPVTIELVEAWTRGLADRGFALAPISAVVSSGPEK
jgi:polysaccharide deacetylase 2 family uncharacterized protein YibQ